MQWPNQPTCHKVPPVFTMAADHMQWRGPRPDSEEASYVESYRTCGYCGSMHPEDLVRMLAQGATLGGSDWKYGWPHKFYVMGIPNPKAGVLVPSYVYSGTRARLGPNAELAPDGKSWREKRSEAPAPATMRAKWYNEHLQDAGYDQEALQVLLAALTEHSGIEWGINENGLYYRAPYGGYQR